MKKVPIILLFSFLFINANAQRHTDLRMGQILVPAAGEKFADSALVPIMFYLKNLGPDSLKTTDTLAIIPATWNPYTHSYTNFTSYIQYTFTHAIHAGDSALVVDTALGGGGLIRLFSWHGYHADSSKNYCIYIDAQNRSADSVVDTDYAHNSNCVSIIFLNVQNAETANAKLAIYPNPIGNEFTIENAEIGSAISIYSAVGQLIYRGSSTSNKEKIDTHNLSVGTYMIHIVNNNGTNENRIVVKQ
jgi:hypothetical protein